MHTIRERLFPAGSTPRALQQPFQASHRCEFIPVEKQQQKNGSTGSVALNAAASGLSECWIETGLDMSGSKKGSSSPRFSLVSTRTAASTRLTYVLYFLTSGVKRTQQQYNSE